MPIATLKTKTQHKYNNMSVGYNQFSLNGTRRSQGYVGQDNMARSFPLTPMRGNVAKGYGGCCGEYHIQNVTYGSGIHSLNDPKVVKSSVLSTDGMMMTKYRWIRRPQPFSTTDDVSNTPMDKNRNCALSTPITVPTDCPKKCPSSTVSYFTTEYLHREPSKPICKSFPVIDQHDYLTNKTLLCIASSSVNQKQLHGTPMGC